MTKAKVKILQRTANAICVTPDGDVDRAAWLRLHEIGDVGQPDGDGFCVVTAPLALLMLRGLKPDYLPDGASQ